MSAGFCPGAILLNDRFVPRSTSTGALTLVWFGTADAAREHASDVIVRYKAPGESRMSRIIPLVVAVLVSLLLAGQVFASQVFAQLTPPAGSAGAGNAPISGVPYGPANPRVLSDPSGLGNASNIPPLRTNTPTITVPQAPLAPARAAAPTYYPYTSHRALSAHSVEPKRNTPPRHRGRREVSSFTGICRGC